MGNWDVELDQNKDRVKTELDQARDTLRNAAWLGTDEEREQIEKAVELLCGEPCGDAISRRSAIFLASDLKQDLPDDEHLIDMVMAHNEGILEYQTQLSLLPAANPQNCDTCEVGNPCLYCKHEFEERSDKE